MADRYWVGGAGAWSSTNTLNWSATSGGSGGASVPTNADNVIFNSASGTGSVQVGSNVYTGLCANFTIIAGCTLTFSTGNGIGSSICNINGNFTCPTGITFNTGSSIDVHYNFTSATSSYACLSSFPFIVKNATGNTLTLANAPVGRNRFEPSGSFNTNNFSFTADAFSISGTGTYNFGTSTITSTGAFSVTGTPVINGSSSTITCASLSFTPSGWSGSGLGSINDQSTATGSNVSNITNPLTCVNYTLSARTSAGESRFNLAANLTCSGAFTCNNTVLTQRVLIGDTTTILAVTITAATKTVNYCDFFRVTGSGTAWTGTSLGDCGGNSNITFPAAKTVYWNLAGAQNWQATGWATSSGGAPNSANFPLPQDTTVFDNTGSVTGTITTGAFAIGTVNMSARTTAMTINPNSGYVFGSWSNGTGTTISSGSTMNIIGARAQTLTPNGVTFTGVTLNLLTSSTITVSGAYTGTSAVNFTGPGTLTLGGNFTLTNNQSFTFNSGILNLNNFSLSGQFQSNNTNTRQIQFGTTGSINITDLTGGSTAFNMNGTNYTYTGTTRLNINNNSVFQLAYSHGTGFTLSNAFDVFVTSTNGPILESNNNIYRNLTYLASMTGTLNNGGNSKTIYGNLTIENPNMGWTGTGTINFVATTGTQVITTNGKIITNPITQNGAGGTVQLADNLTCGNFTLTTGTLNLNNKTLSTPTFSSSATGTRSVLFGTTGNITTTGTGTVSNINGSNLTYTGTSDINISERLIKTVFITSGTSYTIPADFVSLVSVDCIGGGGAVAAGGGGSGGGAFASSNAVTGLVASGTAFVRLGAAADTWFNAASDSAPTLTTQGALAKAGSVNVTTTGGAGGQDASCVGTTRYSGGNGGNRSGLNGSGGAAAGPQGRGAPGISGSGSGGFGGGGANGGSRGSGSTGGTGINGGNGGNGSLFSATGAGSAGSVGTQYTATAGDTAGPGGGGGSAGITSGAGGVGGNYGGGGGGSTNLTQTGTSGLIVFIYVATPVTAVSFTNNTGFTETNALNFRITNGNYTLTETGANVYKNLDYTGFSGTVSNTARSIYGNYTASAAATYTAGTSATTFAATSGTQTITSNGKTLDFPITLSAASGTPTFDFVGALTMGSTRALTFSNGGTLRFTASTTNTVGSFVTTGTTLKFLVSSVSGTQATIAKASGTTTVTYLSIRDSNATGGTWDASAVTNVNVSNNTGWNFASAAGSGNFFLLF